MGSYLHQVLVDPFCEGLFLNSVPFICGGTDQRLGLINCVPYQLQIVSTWDYCSTFLQNKLVYKCRNLPVNLPPNQLTDFWDFYWLVHQKCFQSGLSKKRYIQNRLSITNCVNLATNTAIPEYHVTITQLNMFTDIDYSSQVSSKSSLTNFAHIVKWMEINGCLEEVKLQRPPSKEAKRSCFPSSHVELWTANFYSSDWFILIFFKGMRQ